MKPVIIVYLAIFIVVLFIGIATSIKLALPYQSCGGSSLNAKKWFQVLTVYQPKYPMFQGPEVLV